MTECTCAILLTQMILRGLFRPMCGGWSAFSMLWVSQNQNQNVHQMLRYAMMRRFHDADAEM